MLRQALEENTRLRLLWRIEGGLLAGTEIESVFAFVGVKYAHRKTKDLYVPPIGGKVGTWHCCQNNCPEPDFEGGIEALLKHLEFHMGKLVKRLSPVVKREEARILVNLPPNPWGATRGANDDRRFVVSLYRDEVYASLRKQGIWPIESETEKKK